MKRMITLCCACFCEQPENHLPDSVLAFFEASANRLNYLETLILVHEDDTTSNRLPCSGLCNDVQNELDSSSDEDPTKLNKRIISEIEEEICHSHEDNDPHDDYETNCDSHKKCEMQLLVEWRELEERLRKEDEQRLAEKKAEKEHHLTSFREEMDMRQCRREEFEMELRGIEQISLFGQFKAVEGEDQLSESLQDEMVKQQEIIKRLEEQIQEERQVFEEAQQEQRRKTEERRCRAATKLQAAFRGRLVRRWTKNELNKKREEEKRNQEKIKEIERRKEAEERMMREWEESKKRASEVERQKREEAERRRAEYERAKEQERHRLERECSLEMQRVDQENKKRMEERKIEEVQDEVKKGTKGSEAKIIEEAKIIKGEEEKGTVTEEEKLEEKKRKVEEAEMVDKGKIMDVKQNVIKKEIIRESEKTKRDRGKSKRLEEQKIEDKIVNEEVCIGKEMEDPQIENERKREEKEKRKRIETKIMERMEHEVVQEKKRKEEAMKTENERTTQEEEEKQKWIEAKLIEDGKRRLEEEKNNIEINENKEENANGIRYERKIVKEPKIKVEADECKRKEEGNAKRIEDEEERKNEEKRSRTQVKRTKEENKNINIKEIKYKEESKNAKDERKMEVENQKMIKGKELQNEKREPDVEMKKNEYQEVIPGDKESNINNLKITNINNRQTKEEKKTVAKTATSLTMEDAKGLDDLKGNPKTKRDNKESVRNSELMEKKDRNLDHVPQQHLSQPNILNRSLFSNNGQADQLDPCRTSQFTITNTNNDNVTVEEGNETDRLQGDAVDLMETHENSDLSVQGLSSASLPDSTEGKRLAWMMNCTPWSKLSIQNKRKRPCDLPKKRGYRRASVLNLPPLPIEAVLRSGPWTALKQVTSVTLEDLPGCSLSTLSDCTRLQSLILRRCGLQALEGLNQCYELRHIDVQENSIMYVDCGGLTRLEVLLLGGNQLTSIHGLEGAVNLSVLQLSHNNISRISGLGSLQKLHRLSVDHNQLISTKGLKDVFTLLDLDCSYNHLSLVEGLENCALLHTLNLRGNNLTELPVLNNHVLLRELYVDDNSISSLKGLDSCWLPLQHSLSVAQNSITHLPPLADLLSLRTLDISYNCLSELRNICMSLSGCTLLQDLNLTDNPLQLEHNWRSSVLAANLNLMKLNGEQTGVSGLLSEGSTQIWSFQALCQRHQDQLDSVLQRHSLEISSTPSSLKAQLLLGNHIAELFHLAEEQRYAHEYGDSCVSGTTTTELTAPSCLHDSSESESPQEQSSQAKTRQPEENKTQSWQESRLPGFGQKCQPECAGDPCIGCASNLINPAQNIRGIQANEDKDEKMIIQAPRMHLKTMAATVIQRCWRDHRQKRRMSPSRPRAKPPGRMGPQTAQRSSKTRPQSLNRVQAATVIQAVWRGYALRSRLARALLLARVSEGDEAFEEVDMDEFIFNEEAIESDWMTPDALSSSVVPCSVHLLQPKPPLTAVYNGVTEQLWKPRQAWTDNDGTMMVSEKSLSPDANTSMQSSASPLGLCNLSERSEKILEEWGFSSDSTALLMLKRAQKMKARKQQHQRKLLDPDVRLALFRHHSNRPVAVEPPRKSQPECRSEIKAGRGKVHAQNTLTEQPDETQMQHRTYQWLQSQAAQTKRNSESDHFLPEIDPDILNGGRVQLVACAGYTERSHSAARSWVDGFSSPHDRQAHSRSHSAGHAKKEVPSPQRVTLAPARKERISFRNNPVQLSGGWGGGKKRVQVNKIK
ncbi:leucine-rich repeat and IQ domain-containing protein 1 isoform X2 [Trichomycterus rosablanca]|uniref:leucine-rich repeat and IQ domain-containing protein 1 isoform X2 n=1 Tax=Trichomycterus rosablanca TaxID=2290929 RepID=UPI002F351738